MLEMVAEGAGRSNDYGIALIGLGGVLAGALITGFTAGIQLWVNGKREYRREVRETFDALMVQNSMRMHVEDSMRTAEEAGTALEEERREWEAKLEAAITKGDAATAQECARRVSESSFEAAEKFRKAVELNLQVQKFIFESQALLSRFSLLVSSRLAMVAARLTTLTITRQKDYSAVWGVALNYVRMVSGVRLRDRVSSWYLLFVVRRRSTHRVLLESSRGPAVDDTVAG